MGACLSSPSGSPSSPSSSSANPSPFGSGGAVGATESEKAQHKLAEKEMKEAKAELASQVKVLLLGSGDSGKSTVLKQMRLIHSLPFTPSEIESYRQLAFENLIQGIKTLVEAMPSLSESSVLAGEGGIELGEGVRESWELIDQTIPLSIKPNEPFPPPLEHALQQVWDDEGTRKAWERGNEAALPENLTYFFSHLPRLFKPDYVPTPMDIVQCRARTTGITETTFPLPPTGPRRKMTLVDVGGQRSERRKWIHCFQDVTSILFLVSLSGYDQCIVEDRAANQMQDAMTVWDSICHSQWFRKTSIILFLNKHDLYLRKIPSSDISKFFPDYTGPAGEPEPGIEYFRKRFERLSRVQGAQREFYVHITTATDTNMLRAVMKMVQDMILRGNLEHAGLL